MKKKLNILVTGSTGFVGSHLCELSTKEGHQVFGLARNPEKFKKMDIKANCLQGSLQREGDLPFIQNLPERLDAVFHTAGLVSSFRNQDFYDINFHATENFIKQLKLKHSHLHFIFISSLAAAGPLAPLESDSPKPVSHYGKSKLRAEKSLQDLAPDSWKKTIIRPPMVIGPGDQAVLDIFKMVKNKLVLVAGLKGLENKYSFICVFDLIQLLNHTLSCSHANHHNNQVKVYFSSHPENIKLKDLLGSIKNKLNIKKVRYLKLPLPLIKGTSHFLKLASPFIKSEIRLTPDKVSELAPSSWVCSGELSEKDLSFSYQWGLDKTIEATLLDYQKRGWL